MKHILTKLAAAATLATGALALSHCASGPATNINAANTNPKQLAADSRTALNDLYHRKPAARRLGAKAKAILVFPEITKGGFVFGGMGGNGALIREDGKITEFYQTAGASFGFQAGLQKYGYALFLMDDKALKNLKQSNGWELGSSPNVTIVDEGAAANLSTTTMHKGTYAFFFDQKGLMGDVSLQGAKITRIHPPH